MNICNLRLTFVSLDLFVLVITYLYLITRGNIKKSVPNSTLFYHVYYNSWLSKRFVMLFNPVIMVEPLCRSAELDGDIIPLKPRAINVELKPMTNL